MSALPFAFEPSPMLEFGTMRPSDLDVVHDIERRSYSCPWSREAFLQELAFAFSRVVLARLPASPERPVIAYCCRWLLEDELHVLNLAVHPTWRGRGIGRRVLEHVLSEGRETRVERATLEVRRTNGCALGLYRRLGFERAGMRRDYYGPGDDAIVMQLTLR